MHDHGTCEQLMAAANRSGNYGRLEYLTTRCDRTHGRTVHPHGDHDTDTTEHHADWEPRPTTTREESDDE